MKMVEAARRMNRTLLEMHIGMAFWGLVCQIAGALVMALCGYGVFQGRYALSLWFGVAFAFAGSIHMCRTLDRALLSGGNAGGIVPRARFLRTLDRWLSAVWGMAPSPGPRAEAADHG